MVNGSSPKKQEKKDSIWLFWTIIGVAAVVLILSLAKVGRSEGGKVSRHDLIPVGERKALPPAMLQAYSPAYKNLNTSSLKGRVVVIHFWATWCPPCRAEFPKFARYAGESHGDEGIVVVPVSVDLTKLVVRSYLGGIKEKFPVYMDTGGLAKKIGIRAIPTSILVDRQGRIAWRHKGASNWSPGGVPSLAQILANENG